MCKRSPRRNRKGVGGEVKLLDLVKIPEDKREYDLRLIHANACSICQKTLVIISQHDNFAEYHTSIGVHCSNCDEVVIFDGVPVN